MDIGYGECAVSFGGLLTLRIVGKGVLARVTRWWMHGLLRTVVLDVMADKVHKVYGVVLAFTLGDVASPTIVVVVSTTLGGVATEIGVFVKNSYVEEKSVKC